MGLVVGDIGTTITLDITEPDSNSIQIPTNFLLTDKVDFCFKFSDGSKLTGVGVFLTGSKARYTVDAGDSLIAGRTEIRLEIVSATWDGTSDPPFILTIGKNC